MARHCISAQGHIHQPAVTVYRVLTDYRQHHPRILPPAFRNFAVQEGGAGIGTRFTFDLRVLGRTRHYRGVVTRAEPERYLCEAYPDENSETWFRIDPAPGGCTVTIGTEFDGRDGLPGRLERWMAGLILRPIYADELRRLNEYAGQL